MTQIWNTVAEWSHRRQTLTGRSIGYVPTMGALHRGHTSLVERCRAENEIVVVSIFVNPSQFNDPKDLERYPRTLCKDLALLESLGTDEVFAPSISEMYPHGYRFRVEADSVTKVMEGRRRPGYLEGVMTVVLKLLNIIRADRAYFGEKDYQQLKVITEMNTLLSAAARDKAACLFRALTTAANSDEARAILETEGLAVDYVEEHWGRRFAAAFLEGVRLIDNVPLGADTF